MLKEYFMIPMTLLCMPVLINGIKPSASQQERLVEIDAKLEGLKQLLNQDELDEMQEEAKSQNYVIADWEKYGKEVQKIKQKEEQVKETQRQIQQLEKERARLLMEYPSQPGQ